MSLPSELAARDLDRPEVSVVVPVYNEEAGLAAFWARLAPVLASLAGTTEVVFVDDGSSDGTLAQLLSLRHLDRRVRIVSLSRNFGKEIALTAGLDHADGNAVVPIDADLQHPPEVIGELVARWRDGNDIVIALRRDRATDGFLHAVALPAQASPHGRIRGGAGSPCPSCHEITGLRSTPIPSISASITSPGRR